MNDESVIRFLSISQPRGVALTFNIFLSIKPYIPAPPVELHGRFFVQQTRFDNGNEGGQSRLQDWNVRTDHVSEEL